MRIFLIKFVNFLNLITYLRTIEITENDRSTGKGDRDKENWVSHPVPWVDYSEDDWKHVTGFIWTRGERANAKEFLEEHTSFVRPVPPAASVPIKRQKEEILPREPSKRTKNVK